MTIPAQVRHLFCCYDMVDVRYDLVRQDVMRMLTDIHAIAALQQDARIMQRMTYWLWIARWVLRCFAAAQHDNSTLSMTNLRSE